MRAARCAPHIAQNRATINHGMVHDLYRYSHDLYRYSLINRSLDSKFKLINYLHLRLDGSGSKKINFYIKVLTISSWSLIIISTNL